MPSPAEVRQQITNRIVEALKEKKTLPWRTPWVGSPCVGLPTNIISRRRYSGINVLLLQLHQSRYGLKTKYFGTFHQWKNLGAHVKPRPSDVPPGQWGCQIVFFKPITKVQLDDKGQETEVTYPILRSYVVFGIDQVEGTHLDQFRVGEYSVNPNFIDYEPAEQAIAAVGADIRLGGEEAIYYRRTPDGNGDYIRCPHKHRFPKEHDYYAALLHELGHWSEERLDWKGSYAEGELRAEIAAAFALAALGVPQSQDISNTQAYIASWLAAMENDHSYVFRAATQASKAADFILSFSRTPVDEPEEALAE